MAAEEPRQPLVRRKGQRFRRQAGETHRPTGGPAHLELTQLEPHVLGRPVGGFVPQTEVDPMDLDLAPSLVRQLANGEEATGHLETLPVPVHVPRPRLLEPPDRPADVVDLFGSRTGGTGLDRRRSARCCPPT